MPAKEYIQTIVPRWADIDSNQHLRNSAYADWATYVRTEWLNTYGFNVKSLIALNTAPLTFEENTKYIKEITLGEHITIDLQLVGLNHDASRYHMRQTFRRADTVCAVHEIKGAWLDIANRRIAPPPDGLLEASTNLIRTKDYAEIVSTRN
jgi:acyl-CoA thioester hydrolase